MIQQNFGQIAERSTLRNDAVHTGKHVTRNEASSLSRASRRLSIGYDFKSVVTIAWGLIQYVDAYHASSSCTLL